jgi:hypothetical protein
MNGIDGGPVFPLKYSDEHAEQIYFGITLYDYYASVALHGLLVSQKGALSYNQIGKIAKQIAKIMIEEDGEQ